VRPERITLSSVDSPATQGHNSFRGVVDRVVYLGPATHVRVMLTDGQAVLVSVPNLIGPASTWYPQGTEVDVSFPHGAARLLHEAVQPTDPHPGEGEEELPTDA
jgi:ABC-type Fe3+/spermidine/putrescine transport system ATPase subunit